MRRYWFRLTDERYKDLGAAIPDGNNKRAAVNKAWKWMKDNGTKRAVLACYSMRSHDLLALFLIESRLIFHNNKR